MSQEVLIWGIGLPAVCCAALLLVVLRPWQGAAGGAAGWAAANALAAGFVVSYLVVRDWEIDLPPKRSWEWLAYLVVLVAIVLGYGLSVGGRGKSAWTGWIFASGLCAYLIVGTRVDQFWAWRIVTAAMMVASMSGLDRLREQTNNGVFPFSIGLTAVAACLVLMEARNEALAQMAGALAACLGVIAVMGWWQSSVTLGGDRGCGGNHNRTDPVFRRLLCDKARHAGKFREPEGRGRERGQDKAPRRESRSGEVSAHREPGQQHSDDEHAAAAEGDR